MENKLKCIILGLGLFTTACNSTPPKTYNDLIKQIDNITQQKGFSKIIDCENATLCFHQDTKLNYEAKVPNKLDYLPKQFFVMNDHLQAIGLETFMGNINYPSLSAYPKRLNDPKPLSKLYKLNGYFLFKDLKKECEVLSYFTLVVRYKEISKFDGLEIVTTPRKIDRDYPILHRITIDESACK